MNRRILGLILLILVLGSSNSMATTPSVILPINKNAFHPVIIEHDKLYGTIDLDPLNTPRPSIPVKPIIRIKTSLWKLDPEISWYGPGFYGHRTACGKALTTALIGVAHRTLPCGTIVVFTWKGITIEAPVVDRGPYVKGRIFDLTGGTCVKLNHCFTGKIYYYIKR